MTNEGVGDPDKTAPIIGCKMTVNRRRFLATAAGSAAALSGTILRASGQETPPPRRGRLIDERRLAVASFGVGGRGETNTILMVGQDMKALCDVDDSYLTSMGIRYPSTKPYFDW